MSKIYRINGEAVIAEKKQLKRKRKRFLFFILIVGILLLVVQYTFKLKTIIIIGNERYTEEEIVEMVHLDRFHNALIYYLITNQKEFEDLPFIEAIDIQLTAFNEIKVQVFEKQVIGCIEYMGMYLYFDKEGRMVESLSYQSENIPIVYGLKYDKIVLYETIPVEEPQIFHDILTIIQMLDKYDVHVNKILITQDDEFVLVKEDLRVLLGTNDRMNDKIAQLKKLLPNLLGEKGELDLKQIDRRIYFKKDV